MLIRSLRAEGFLKFRKLRIDNFPRRGLIGIVGPNESGKSSIGQLFQFALFGSTHHMVRGSITDLIHWDDDHCVVELDFEHAGDGYRIWREMDRFGTSFARMVRIDKSGGPPGEEIASGALQVQREVQRRFHLGAGETMHSFYLAERESVTTPEQFRAFLDRVAGIDVLHGARRQASQALDLLEKDFTTVQDEIHRNDQHIQRLQPNIDKIPDLEEELNSRDLKVEEARAHGREMQRLVERELKKRDEVQKIQGELRSLDTLVASESRRKCNGLIGLLQADLLPEPLRDQDSITAPLRDGLEQISDACKIRVDLEQCVIDSKGSLQRRLEGDQEGSIAAEREIQEHQIRKETSSRVRNRAGAVVLFIAGLLGMVLGLDHELEWGIGTGIPFLAQLESEKGIGFLVAAVFAGLFVVACWLSTRSSQCHQLIFDARGILSRLQMEQDVGSSSLEAARAHVSRSSGGLDPGDDIGECRVRSVQENLDLLRIARREIHVAMGDQPGESLAGKLKSVLDRVRATLKERRKSLDESSDSVKRLRSKSDRIQSEIREYQNQDGRRQALAEISAGSRKKSLAIREEMDIHRLLVELLDETIESVRMRAGPSLGKGLCRLLPHLTGGRYRDAQVTPDFEIRLFTGEKSDFLQTHELSGGTLQGLSFGFRLAFAQAFVRAVTGAPQFLFLDEPFPAMDRQRVLRTLQALPRLSQELSQVIVAHPDLDLAARQSFDLLIETDQSSNRLEIDLEDMSLPEVSAPRREPAQVRPASSRRESAPRRES
ncbi:MAG: AAA family ATPase, partial [Planctomycetota bacterium]|nr:AAA family ATPase [Planctomycetota bacterium]